MQDTFGKEFKRPCTIECCNKGCCDKDELITNDLDLGKTKKVKYIDKSRLTPLEALSLTQSECNNDIRAFFCHSKENNDNKTYNCRKKKGIQVCENKFTKKCIPTFNYEVGKPLKISDEEIKEMHNKYKTNINKNPSTTSQHLSNPEKQTKFDYFTYNNKKQPISGKDVEFKDFLEYPIQGCSNNFYPYYGYEQQYKDIYKKYRN